MYALTILPFLAIHRMYAGIKDMDGDGQVDAQDILIWLQRLYSLVFDESLKRVQAWWQRQGGWVMDLYEAAGKKFENGITAPGKTKHVQKSLHNWAGLKAAMNCPLARWARMGKIVKKEDKFNNHLHKLMKAGRMAEIVKRASKKFMRGVKQRRFEKSLKEDERKEIKECFELFGKVKDLFFLRLNAPGQT